MDVRTCWIWLAVAYTAAAEPVAFPRPAPHPRLLFTSNDQRRVTQLATSEPLLQELIRLNRKHADDLLRAAPLEYRIPDGKRLLGVSRDCIERVLVLAMASRLTGNRRYAERAAQEMLNAAAFKDWNPAHFLDTAEMTAALALGYDWLYGALSADQRVAIRKAIVNLGLQPGLRCYEKGNWWVACHHNWNQVCNGGLLLGALALQEDEPAVAEPVLRFALASITNGLSVYAPEGVYPEGPGYWTYGTTYTVLTMEALRTALGSDYGISRTRGLERTTWYIMNVLGPTDKAFNYADGHEGTAPEPAFLRLATLYGQAAALRWHRAFLQRRLAGRNPPRDRYEPLEIAWYQPAPPPATRALPLDAVLRGHHDILCLRAAWDRPDALFVACKAGRNNTNHGHLDIGTFVLDADGQRWACDLGGDNYNMPGYFGRQRWDYFRNNTLSHNTLSIGGASQPPDAACQIVGAGFTPEQSWGLLDMTDAYRKRATRVRRGVRLLDRRTLLLQDEVEGATDPVRWGMVTQASLRLDGTRARLERGGRTLTLHLLEPPGAAFAETATRPPTAQEDANRGTRLLTVTATPRAGTPLRIVVWCVPGSVVAPEGPTLEPLDAWNRSARP